MGEAKSWVEKQKACKGYRPRYRITGFLALHNRLV